MPFFSTSIPQPADPTRFQQFGHLRLGNDRIDIYWRRAERQIVFHKGNRWFLQPDEHIRKSIATLMPCMERDLVTVRLQLFEHDRFHNTDTEMKNGFLDCEWSDFASDYMILSAYVQHRDSAPAPDEMIISLPVLDDEIRTPPRVRRLPFYM